MEFSQKPIHLILTAEITCNYRRAYEFSAKRKVIFLGSLRKTPFQKIKHIVAWFSAGDFWKNTGFRRSPLHKA